MNHLDKHAFDIITKYKAEIETLDAGFVASRHLVATKGKTSHQLRQKLLARSKIIDRCLISLWRLCKLDRENEIVQWEHTILVTPTGREVLTYREGEEVNLVRAT